MMMRLNGIGEFTALAGEDFMKFGSPLILLHFSFIEFLLLMIYFSLSVKFQAVGFTEPHVNTKQLYVLCLSFISLVKKNFFLIIHYIHSTLGCSC